MSMTNVFRHRLEMTLSGGVEAAAEIDHDVKYAAKRMIIPQNPETGDRLLKGSEPMHLKNSGTLNNVHVISL